MPIWLEIIILGIIEGITEFLPISSTGHLLLVQTILTRQSDLFNVVIQMGAVLAILPLFSTRIKSFMQATHDPNTKQYIQALLLSFMITAIGGLLLKKMGFHLPDTIEPVAWSTFLGGIAILLIDRQPLAAKHIQYIPTWSIACACGIAQLIAAIFPGTSRSGITILTALTLGMKRGGATEFSFLLGVPTLLAAGMVEILQALQASNQANHWFEISLGTIVAGITAFIVVRWLLRFVSNNTFAIFGWYRLILGSMLLWKAYWMP